MAYVSRNVLRREEPSRGRAFPRLHGWELDQEPEFGNLLPLHVTWAPWDVSRYPRRHQETDDKGPAGCSAREEVCPFQPRHLLTNPCVNSQGCPKVTSPCVSVQPGGRQPPVFLVFSTQACVCTEGLLPSQPRDRHVSFGLLCEAC